MAHAVQPVVRSSPVQMMAPEMSSRRAALLSAASLLAMPLAAQAKPEDYYGGCACSPHLLHEHRARVVSRLSCAAGLATSVCSMLSPCDMLTFWPKFHSCSCRPSADTTKMYKKTYGKNPDKGGACPPPGGPFCQNPGGSPNDPLISRPSAFEKISKPIPVVMPPAKEEPKKEEAKAEAAPAPAS